MSVTCWCYLIRVSVIEDPKAREAKQGVLQKYFQQNLEANRLFGFIKILIEQRTKSFKLPKQKLKQQKQKQTMNSQEQKATKKVSQETTKKTQTSGWGLTNAITSRDGRGQKEHEKHLIKLTPYQNQINKNRPWQCWSTPSTRVE